MTKGQRIKSRREELGIGQSDLAKKIGISKQSLYKYENDIVTNIPSDVIEKIAWSLDVSPAFLMGWTEPDAHYADDFERFYELNKERSSSRIALYLDMFSKLSQESQDKVIDYMTFQAEREDKTDG